MKKEILMFSMALGISIASLSNIAFADNEDPGSTVLAFSNINESLMQNHSIVNYFSSNSENNIIFTEDSSVGSTYSPNRELDLPINQYLAGWTDERNSDIVKYNINITSRELNLYPVVKNRYFVYFDTKGGLGEGTVKEVKEGENPVLPETPTKEGFTFLDWYNEDGSVFDENLPITENKTVYAEWEQASSYYTINYYKETLTTGEYEKVAEKQINISNSELQNTISVSTLASEVNYPHFSFDAGNSSSDIVPASDNSTVIDIRYTRDTYELVFDINGNKSNVSALQYSSPNFTFDNSATRQATYSFRAKYGEDLRGRWPTVNNIYSNPWLASNPSAYFVGWTNVEGNQGYLIVDVLNDTMIGTATNGSTITFKAFWANYVGQSNYHTFLQSTDLLSYIAGTSMTVQIPLQNQAVSPLPIEGFTIDTTRTRTENQTTKNFGAWYAPQNYTWYADHYYYYNRNTYSIKFINNGTEEVAESLIFGMDISDKDRLPNTVLENKTFKGWYDEDGLKFEFTNKTMPAKDLILTAKFEETTQNSATPMVSYIVGSTLVNRLPLQNGRAQMPDTTPVYIRTMADSDYDFVAWYTADNQVFDFNSYVDRDITLFAKFEPKPVNYYTIKYDGNMGVGNKEVIYRYAPGTSIIVAEDNIFTKIDNSFRYYTLIADDNTDIYMAGSKYVFSNEDAVLYAYWEEDEKREPEQAVPIESNPSNNVATPSNANNEEEKVASPSNASNEEEKVASPSNASNEEEKLASSSTPISVPSANSSGRGGGGRGVVSNSRAVNTSTVTNGNAETTDSDINMNNADAMNEDNNADRVSFKEDGRGTKIIQKPSVPKTADNNSLLIYLTFVLSCLSLYGFTYKKINFK